MSKAKRPLRGKPLKYKCPDGSKSGLLVEDTLKGWFDAKHPRPSEAALAWINSIRPEGCRFCGCRRIVRCGRTNAGIERYKCRRCGRRFTPLTGTLFDSFKIPPSEWVEWLFHLFEFHSLRTSAWDNRNADTTGKYWLMKVFEALGGSQDGVVLSGRVYEDETSVRLVSKALRRKPDGKMYRGISRNRISIAVMREESTGRTVVVPIWRAKPTKESILLALGPHIAPGSTLIHDGENSHASIVEALALESEVHPTSETKLLSDAENPLDPINDEHQAFKEFLHSHRGYDRSRLQGWCDLFAFIWNPPEEPAEKAKKLLETIVSTSKVIRYRTAFRRKDKKDP